MVATASSASGSLKEYLKRYENSNNEATKKKKKKKNVKSDAAGVIVVDEDPVWQKPLKLEEEESDDSPDEEKPQVDEDIEVKRMKRLEQLKARRPFGAISDDGSGWVSVSDTKPLNSSDQNSDMSPPRKRRARNDTPSPEPELKPSEHTREVVDSSPSWQQQKCYHTARKTETQPLDSSSQDPENLNCNDCNRDISPPRRRRNRYDTPSLEPKMRPSESGRVTTDLSPPRERQKRSHSPVSEAEKKPSFSYGQDPDFSPPRRPHPQTLVQCEADNSEIPGLPDISPPRRTDRSFRYQEDSCASPGADISPQRKSRRDRHTSHDLPFVQSDHRSTDSVISRVSSVSDLSPPRKTRKVSASVKEQPKTGLISGQDIKEENAKTRRNDWLRFKEMDPSLTGRGAEPVYRDRRTGERISKEELQKLTQKEEKPKEINLEWGKGLAQKREAEERQQELALERDKPFARTRDDPELDRMMKERVRWGDPMAHLVKKKNLEPILEDLGDSDKMKESGFIIPQDIPSHSWIKRGLDAAPNRYGIRPGRHWDGVDRSSGYEKELFKRMNEKRATDREAYLWSVSDM